MGITGERLTSITRCLRTPTTSEWRNGRFIDAGLAMVLSSNLSHLQRESVRQLACTLGPGALTNGVRGYTYSGTALLDTSDPGTYSDLNAISWDLQTAVKLGPFFLIGDREPSGESLAPRKIRVAIDCDGAALTLLAALTPIDARPDSTVYASATATVTTGRTIETLELLPDRGIPISRISCRRQSTSSAEVSGVYAANLWVGFLGASGTNAVISISAYETRT